jgi:hypothetical protein
MQGETLSAETKLFRIKLVRALLGSGSTLHAIDNVYMKDAFAASVVPIPSNSLSFSYLFVSMIGAFLSDRLARRERRRGS